MTPLCELAKKYGTDKLSKHHYTPTYYELLKDRKVNRVLEVGIAFGASLRMWEAFFPDAQIFGFDRNPDCMINEGRITSILGNQADEKSVNDAAYRAGGMDCGIDLIIDDGDHDPFMQIKTMETLLPYLSRNGIYIIEDVKCGDSWRDDPEGIVGVVPVGFSAWIVRTEKKKGDSVLIIIERK